MSHVNVGHKRARRLYRELGDCERCGEVPARDRHHRDGDPFNNDRGNVAFLCRRCHQIEDGRFELLRTIALRQAQAQTERTHCPRGHAYDEENTYITPAGERRCRACRRIPNGRGPYRRRS